MQTISCQQRVFGTLPNGETIICYTLRNTTSGMVVSVINYGATLTSVQLPDSRGKMHEMTLGFDKFEDYLNHTGYSGATIGRVANSISSGRFEFQEHTHQLNSNNEQSPHPHHWDGGPCGFDKAVWASEVFTNSDAVGVEFTLVSPAGDQGYPGELTVTTTYALNSENQLKISFQAKTNQPTPIDLTNHTYWNLAGVEQPQATLHDHVLQVPAERYLVVDSDQIPTGALAEVKGTPFDFLQPQRLGASLEQLTAPEGYHVYFVLTDQNPELKMAALIKESVSGRTLKVSTTQPGFYLHTGTNVWPFVTTNNTNSQTFCLETQNLPGAVHHPEFSSPFLMPDEQYHHETVYEFIW
jgi:aldose 1-epimerase